MDKNFGIMMEEIEIEFVIKHLQKKRDGQTKMLEWGIGGSTLLFPLFVDKYVTVEHNLDWYIEVKNMIIEANNHEPNVVHGSKNYKWKSNVIPYLIDIPKEVPTARGNFYDKFENEILSMSEDPNTTIADLNDCIDTKKKYIWSDYINVINLLNIPKYDFIFIDGRARADCAYIALNYIDDDSVVFIHDFWPRERYHKVLDYYDVYDKIESPHVDEAGNKLSGGSIVALRRKK